VRDQTKDLRRRFRSRQGLIEDGVLLALISITLLAVLVLAGSAAISLLELFVGHL
jgi:Flp pilus assembly pilin Flp